MSTEERLFSDGEVRGEVMFVFRLTGERATERHAVSFAFGAKSRSPPAGPCGRFDQRAVSFDEEWVGAGRTLLGDLRRVGAPRFCQPRPIFGHRGVSNAARATELGFRRAPRSGRCDPAPFGDDSRNQAELCGVQRALPVSLGLRLVPMYHSTISRLLIELRERDLETRSRLAASGALFDGYHPEMEAVHVENARTLAQLVEKIGWPGWSRVGEEAADAAWLVAQHAISCPDLQRRFLCSLEEAVGLGEASPLHAAYLTDRVRYNASLPQVYGTLFDWDEADELSPWLIEDADAVEERRRVVGLPSLSESVARVRKEAAAEGVRPGSPHKERRAAHEEWARKVGWLVEETSS